MSNKMYWIEGKCYIDKINRDVFFKCPINASTKSQAGYFIIEKLQSYFSTTDYLLPSFKCVRGMNSTMSHLKQINFVIYEDKALTIKLDRNGKRLNNPGPKIKKLPRKKDDLPF